MNLWHFTAHPGILRDGTLFSLGQKLTLEGRIVPCEREFHGSPSVLDALEYARGPHLYAVDLGGTIVPHGEPIDKYAASERTAIAYLDATDVLRAFARACALDVIHLWDAPDVVRQYLETGDESVRVAARDAAWDAWDAARAARDARDAARAAARYAARDARDAARDARYAAWDAAVAAAWDAMDAAEAKQRERLDAMILKKMEEQPQ